MDKADMDETEQSDVRFLLGKYYVVQIGDEWHVLFEPDNLPRHFLSIARFQDFERAEYYADMHQDFQHDYESLEFDDMHAIPDLSKTPIKAIEVLKPLPREPDVDRPLSDLGQEILSDLDRLMKEYPYGASVTDLADYYGLRENPYRVRGAIRSLTGRKLARFEKWADDNEKRLVALNYDRPPMRLTDTEKSIISAVKNLLDADGTCRASPRTIARIANVSTHLVSEGLWRIARKGFLTMTDPTCKKSDCKFPDGDVDAATKRSA